MKSSFESAEKLFLSALEAADVAEDSLEAACATGDDTVVRAANEKYDKACEALSLAADVSLASIIITASNRLAAAILRRDDIKQCEPRMPPRSIDCDDEVSAFLLAQLDEDNDTLDLGSLKYVRQQLIVERAKHVEKMDSVFNESLDAEGELAEPSSAKVDKIRHEANIHITVLEEQIFRIDAKLEQAERKSVKW